MLSRGLVDAGAWACMPRCTEMAMAQVGLAMLAGWMMPQAAAMDRSTAQMDREGTCRPSWRPPPARHGCPAKALMRSRCMAHAASWFASGACRLQQRPPGGKEQAVHRRPSNLPPCVDLPDFSLSGARRPDAPAAWAPVRPGPPRRHTTTQAHTPTRSARRRRTAALQGQRGGRGRRATRAKDRGGGGGERPTYR